MTFRLCTLSIPTPYSAVQNARKSMKDLNNSVVNLIPTEASMMLFLCSYVLNLSLANKRSNIAAASHVKWVRLCASVH